MLNNQDNPVSVAPNAFSAPDSDSDSADAGGGAVGIVKDVFPITVQDLTVTFGSFVAVDHLSFQVRPGEIFGLLGPNGAGKTTTFLSLTRQIRVNTGAISIFGWDVQKDFHKIKPHFGYVADSDNHIEEFSAWQNLMFFANLYGVTRDYAQTCLERVELWRERDNKVSAFSKGMRKKLLLARELLHRPKLLLLDEPTANLDVHSTALVRELILQLTRDEGMSVLITTHDMNEVEQVCDRVAIINHGRLIDLDSPIGFRSRNTEKIVDVVLDRGAHHEKVSVHLDNDRERGEFADLLRSEIPLTVHTREFHFHEVFLKLTGEQYN